MKRNLRLLGAAWAAAFSLAAAAVEPADLARAEAIVAGRCFLCHGLEGESASPVFPRLAGQHPRYVEDQLKRFISASGPTTMR